VATLLVGCLCVQDIAVAEDLPTTGIFEGVYHRDRWGVGHFYFFIVHPDLHEKLSKYEGQVVRVEVTKGEQPENPGPALMLGVGEVIGLPQPLVEIAVKTRPSKVRAGQPFQLVVEVTNRSRDGLLLHPESVWSTIRQPRLLPGLRPEEPSWLTKAYTNAQLYTKDEDTQVGGWNTFDAEANLTGEAGRVMLTSGASCVWVRSFPNGLPSGDGELKVHMIYQLAKADAAYGNWTSQGTFEVWRDFDVSTEEPGSQPVADAEPLLSVSEVHVTPGDEGWTNLQFNVAPSQGKRVRVPGTISRATGAVDPEKYADTAQLLGFAADGSAIELLALRLPQRDTPDGIAQLLDLPEGGAVIRASFRKKSRFAPPMRRLLLRVLTDSGLETVVLSDDFKDADASPQTPFGRAAAGVRIRIRPAKPAFKGGEPLSFHVQAVNVSGKPVCWWRPLDGLGENVAVEVDGRQVEQSGAKAEFIGGWAAEWTCKKPQEWSVTLPDATVGKGRHTLRYIIVSNGGEYRNANGEMIPIARGRISSNEVEFTVE
jgi:hypothetical protein